MNGLEESTKKASSADYPCFPELCSFWHTQNKRQSSTTTIKTSSPCNSGSLRETHQLSNLSLTRKLFLTVTLPSLKVLSPVYLTKHDEDLSPGPNAPLDFSGGVLPLHVWEGPSDFRVLEPGYFQCESWSQCFFFKFVITVKKIQLPGPARLAIECGGVCYRNVNCKAYRYYDENTPCDYKSGSGKLEMKSPFLYKRCLGLGS